ncbi:phytase [Lysobacter sp. F60174L2]|uniref:phytase n=1 Tax=Lysobacter sp. F60174L2 TaxID=3459295 RepID=UPI00403DCEA3
MQLRFTPLAAVLASTLLLAACASGPAGSEREPDEGDEILAPTTGYATVAEAFLTANTPAENTDSPASWTDDAGRTLLVATAKDTHRLNVYDGDTGEHIRDVGGEGPGLGEFNRPNGIAVLDDLLLVVERDNRRVQVLRLPGFEPLGAFGQDELRQPYGLWVNRLANGVVEVLVSDNYMSPADEDLPPPLAELDERIKRYHLDAAALADGNVQVQLAGMFGDTTAAGAIRITESLLGDPAHDRLLISEEDQAGGTLLREYGLDGRFRGRNIGADVFQAQAEGIALWQCDDGSGYWIATDQFADRSLFHVFDRISLAHLGVFAGNTVANTDGVWLQQAPTARFPAGVFYAVNDDQGIGAFDWRDIARALDIKATCS